jgi:hypothetical protein
MTDTISRRVLLGRAVVAAATLAAVTVRTAQGAEPAGYTHLDPKDPSAAALGYVSDAKTVDVTKYKSYKAGQQCASCLQLQGAPPDAWRPCILYPKKLVNVNGWCSGYVKKA